MNNYYMTERETALMLQALCIARRHCANSGDLPESFTNLFNNLVAQHDAQQEVIA